MPAPFPVEPNRRRPEVPTLIGETLAHYRVTAAIGAGGMGEVYRATDTKLGREVAIKVLPAVLASDPERLARFEREARVLASLNHPGIAHLYGFESATLADGTTAHVLVMELVEGEDLAERLKRGKVPVDEAVAIAKQVAEALEEAHEKGIVHRDLKPANVKLTPDGKVKVLDFGLAKAWSGEGPGATSSADLSQSPTLAATGTAAGIILGTAAYMSPEQARGKAVDKRVDIWAFSVLVFEMLTGRRLFEGETVSDTLAAVLRQDVDWAALPGATPPRVQRLLRRCLERDPRTRLRDIGEARVALDRADAPEPHGHARTAAPGPRLRALPWAVAAALAVVAAVAAWRARGTESPPAEPVRLAVELTDDLAVRAADRSMGTTVVLSPAGDRLAFVAAGDAAPIYWRRLDSLTASPVAGTEGGSGPFFSPTGESIAFFANGQLKTVALSGGAVTTLAEAPDHRGGAWLEDGTIVFAPRVESTLERVPAGGGTPAPATTLDAGTGERTHRWPDALPAGRGLLYTAHGKTGNYEEASLVVEGPGGSPRHVLVKGGTHGRYLPSGHVVYWHDQTLYAAPFDLDRLALAGVPAPVVQGVAGTAVNGTAQFSVARSGLLAYQPTAASPSLLGWLDRSGRSRPLRGRAGSYAGLRLSPEGDRAALVIEDGGRSDIWVLDLARDTLSRLTFGPDNDVAPSWAPDGRRIAYASWCDDVGALNLFWRRADGAGEPERLTTSPNRQWPGSWHPGGRFLAFTEARPAATYDLMVLPLEGDETSGLRPGAPRVFLSTPFQEQDPEFSPDGRWLAYSSNESGRWEVYVRPFPGPGGRWQISSGSGTTPRWSRAKPELLYQSGRQVMAVSYTVVDGSFRAARPRPWVELPAGTVDFDPHPDGERLALVHPERDTSALPPTRVLFFHFLEELRRRAPRAGTAAPRAGDHP
jgi:serine/threonine-protein kinase